MTDTKKELGQDCDSSMLLDINDDIIDISALDFCHPDTLLQQPSQDFLDDGIRDIRAWLKNDTEQDCNNSQDKQRSIDTRTFTRPKKRLGRLSFESIVERNVPTSSNVWNQAAPSVSTKKSYKDETEYTTHEKDPVPYMLRPSIPGMGAVFSTNSTLTSGQESLEAFINMSQSKAIDSFIDLVEPEFDEDPMEISQPSLLFSSMTSAMSDDPSATANDLVSMNQPQISRQPGIEDSQILTASMMETSLFGDVVDVNFNDTFAKNGFNVTVLENTVTSVGLGCNPMDTTFLATAITTSTETFNSTFNSATFSRENIQSMNTTYIPSQLNLTISNDPHASYIVHRSTNEMHNVANFDATFEKSSVSSAKKSFTNLAPDACLTANKVPTTTNERTINETFRAPSSEKITANFDENIKVSSGTHNVDDFDATFEKSPTLLPKKSFIKLAPETRLTANDVPTIMNEPAINETFSAPSSEKITANFDENIQVANRSHKVDDFDATFEKRPTLLPKKSLMKLASETRLTANDVPTEMNKPAINETFRAPISEKITANVDDNIKLASRTHNVDDFDVTFEKKPTLLPKKSLIRVGPETRLTANDVPTIMNEPTINETFRAPSCDKITTKLDDNVDPLSRGGSLDNLDATFCQPAPNIPRQLALPRPLSRLPQSLQKSNPNLGSNPLKTSNTITRSGIPSLGSKKASRPSTARNVESSLSSKLYGFGRIKSGSEQRLAETRNSTELQSIGTGGSTESIESTQSAHSAPDFDDRLSVQSDGSSASYSRRTMNIDEFQKTVPMRGEFLKPGSTPKPSRTVLENNWVAASNDLPSPILKHDPDKYSSRGSSPRSTDSTVKTSSPLLSPTESLQNLTMDVVKSNNDNIEGNKITVPRIKTAVPNKISQASGKPQRNPSEQKTGLRPPANWTSASRPASGIPRPASRIPAPKFTRPNTKINQGDTKK